MSLTRYLNYKHSGVDWLGEVPSHWEIERFKNVMDLRKVTVGDTKGDYTLLSLTLQGVIARDMVNPKGKFPAEFDTYQVVEKEDLVFCLFDVEETPRAVGVSPCTGMVTGAYTVGRAKAGISAQYLYNFYLSRDQYKAFKMYYTGLRNVIRSETFNTIPCPVPPIDEQIGIAKFLETETAKIDNLVTEQEKLIELLKEKRQSVIVNAVTKGLNPKAKMKDSGVEWLGVVPEHWTLRKLKYISEFAGGGTPSRENLDFWNGEIPWVSPKDMKMEFLENSEEKITQQGLKNSSSNLIEAGQILMVVRSGILKHTIPVAINIIPVSMNQDMKALKFSKTICISEFFMRWVQGLNDLLLLEWAKQGATVESIEHNYLKETVIPLPPLEEQIQITQYLKRVISEFEGLMNSSESSINLLQERRSALISAAVTGQIDVRNFQVKEAS
jgi:type I restriction enzyme S subunit